MTPPPLQLGSMTAALVRQHAVCVRDISSTGALIELRSRIQPGAVGLLQLDVDGRTRLEVFRVCRVLTVAGSGVWHIGVEFLPIAPAGDSSLRATFARFELPATGDPTAGAGLKSGGVMTFPIGAAGGTGRRDGDPGDSHANSTNLIPAEGLAITGSPVAQPRPQWLTPRRIAPIEEDK